MSAPHLSLARAFAINELTLRLLARAELTTPPVSTDLLHRLNPELEVELAPLGKVAGALRLGDDGAVIYVNESQPVVRQRFSIAHEYGHYLLHHRAVLDGEAGATATVRELEADRFAALLLVPLPWLDALVPQAPPDAPPMTDQRLTLKLASRFNVSPSCMRRALAGLVAARSAFTAA